MSRKIKFRGRTKEGEWLYGDFFHVGNRAFIVDCPSFENRDTLWGYCEVDPDTVGESTGLCDGKQTETYFNDKITFKTINGGIGRGIVDYDMGRYFCRMKTVAIYEFAEFEEFEVVGNIHDKEND